MDFATLARVHLREGAGGGALGAGFCVMELVSFIGGERVTDQPDCASPFLTAAAIALNDGAPSGVVRDEMKPLAFRLVGTRDPGNEWRRWDYLLRASAALLLAPLVDGQALNVEARALRDASTRRDLAEAGRAAASALAYVSRSHASANIRAAAANLAAACARGPKSPQALRDSLHCMLVAPGDAEVRLALWREAYAILEAAIELGKRSDHEPPSAFTPSSVAVVAAE